MQEYGIGLGGKKSICRGIIFRIFQHQAIASENMVIISDINKHMTLKPGLISECAHNILMKV